MLSVGAKYNDNEEFCSNRALLNELWQQMAVFNKKVYTYDYRRKFRSETSDNMDS